MSTLSAPPQHQEPSDALPHSGAPLCYKNALVMYQGGGYSGCFWEWNCFMFDEDGEFYNIHTSGYAGLKTETQAREALADEDWVEDKAAEIIDLTSEEALVKFTEDFNGTMVRGIFKFLEENDMPYVLSFRCETCKEVCKAHVPSTHHMVCSGGLAYSDRDIHCEDCHSEHSCEECGEFWENIEAFVDGLCEFCAKNHCTVCRDYFDKEEELDENSLCSVCRTIEAPNPNQPELPYE